MHGLSVVEHHTKLGHNVLIAPGVAIASDVTIESHSFLGVGTKIAPSLRIGTGTLLGAGSVVIKDIPSHMVAFGQPACPVRRVREDDEVPTEEAITAAARSAASRSS
jgi:acetyltransferase-like isoleucine patch superfamily enzyme